MGKIRKKDILALLKVIGVIAGSVICVLLLLVVCGYLSTQIKWPAFADPNTLPINIQHSPIAAEKIANCEYGSSYSSEGRDRFYVNAMIECLYAAGFELEYNGEPVRREVTQP